MSIATQLHDQPAADESSMTDVMLSARNDGRTLREITDFPLR